MSVLDSTPTLDRSAAAIQNWLVSYLAGEMAVAPDEIDVTVPFDRYGLSSMTAVIMTGELEEWLGIDVDPTLPYDYPTVEALSEALAAQIQERESK